MTINLIISIKANLAEVEYCTTLTNVEQSYNKVKVTDKWINNLNFKWLRDKEDMNITNVDIPPYIQVIPLNHKTAGINNILKYFIGVVPPNQALTQRRCIMKVEQSKQKPVIFQQNLVLENQNQSNNFVKVLLKI